MGVTEKTAILVISFGTSYEETRKKTIEQIESDLHHAFPEYPLYRAWTSPRIRAKLRKRDGIHIMDIDEAMTQLKADGIRNVIVQPIPAQLPESGPSQLFRSSQIHNDYWLHYTFQYTPIHL